MEISTTRLDRIVAYVGGIPIEFDVENLNNILGIPSAGHRIYTSRKTLLIVRVYITFFGIGILLVIFVLFLFGHNYCLYKFEFFTSFYSTLSLLGRVIQMRSQGWMLGYCIVFLWGDLLTLGMSFCDAC